MSSEEGLNALLGAYGSSDEESEGARDGPSPAEIGHATKSNADNAHQTEATMEPREPEEPANMSSDAQPPSNHPQEAAAGLEQASHAVAGAGPVPSLGSPQTAAPADDALAFLPPELGVPPGECDPAVQDRVARWLALQAQGRHLIHELRRSRDYRNPEFFRKMVEYWEIDEHGTFFPPEIFNPNALPVSDTLPALQKEWAEEDERRRAARAAGQGRVEFTRPASQPALASNAIAAAQAKAAALAAAAGIRR